MQILMPDNVLVSIYGDKTSQFRGLLYWVGTRQGTASKWVNPVIIGEVEVEASTISEGKTYEVHCTADTGLLGKGALVLLVLWEGGVLRAVWHSPWRVLWGCCYLAGACMLP